ncbi:MAG TPA: DUF4339 domain-containing protein [Chthoniobacteraceae bacterium]|jgi:hypothetical protein
MTRFYVSRNGQETGPFTEEEVKALLQSGTIGRGDLFRAEGAQSWLPLSDFGTAAPPAQGTPPAAVPTAPAPSASKPTEPDDSHGLAKTIAIIILLLLLLIGGCRFLHRSHSKSTAESTATPAPIPTPGPPGAPVPISAFIFPPPNYEQWFVENVENFKTRYPAARDDNERSYGRSERALSISHALPGVRTLDQWVGILRKADPTLTGKLAVVVEIPKGDLLQTWPDPVSDIGSNTLIDKDSDLYKRIRAIPIGSPILFDFEFLEDKNDFVKEGSKTVLEGMVSPKFIVRFKEMKVAKK